MPFDPTYPGLSRTYAPFGRLRTYTPFALAREDTGWRTIHGAKVHIGKDGDIDKGPAHLVGKEPGEVKSDHMEGSKSGEKGAWHKTGADLGTVYHGSKKKIDKVDPAKLQARDSGFYGGGFYTTTSADHAKTYGKAVSAFRLPDDATVLHAALKPEDAPPGLVEEVKRHMLETGMERAKARGKEDALRAEVADIDKNHLSWSAAVERYARDKDYDAVKHTDGEIVVRNHGKLIPAR